MPQRKHFIPVAVTAVLLIAIALAAVVVIDLAMAPASELQVYEPAALATPEDAARSCKLPIPPEAKNIRAAGWSQSIAHEDYLRLEAPVAVCLRHAAVLVPTEPLTPVSADRLAMDARPPQGIFHDISWFDLSSAQNVVGAGGGSQRPQVWVDQNRGVLYYRLCD